jgi:hypothetical protein
MLKSPHTSHGPSLDSLIPCTSLRNDSLSASTIGSYTLVIHQSGPSLICLTLAVIEWLPVATLETDQDERDQAIKMPPWVWMEGRNA